MQTQNHQPPQGHLPIMAMRDIPEPGPNAQRITALVKRGGRVDGYQLQDGRVLTKQEGVDLARQGGILGVGISARNGSEYLKAIPDGSEDNNLGNLPSISDGQSPHSKQDTSITGK